MIGNAFTTDVVQFALNFSGDLLDTLRTFRASIIGRLAIEKYGWCFVGCLCIRTNWKNQSDEIENQIINFHNIDFCKFKTSYTYGLKLLQNFKIQTLEVVLD